VTVVSIVGSDPFHSFDPVAQNKPQFRGLNLIHKIDDRLKKFITVIEYAICKRCLDMAAKPKVGRRQVRMVWQMRNSNERIFTKKPL
jgi:hypothetical protein